MRTKFISILRVFSFLLLFTTPFISSAQTTPTCPYMVVNGTECQVNVTVVFVDCSSIICQSYTQSILSNSPAYFGCGNCIASTLCDVQVTVNWIGTSANTVSGGYVDSSTNMASGTYTAACDGNNGIGMAWGSSSTDIHLE